MADGERKDIGQKLEKEFSGLFFSFFPSFDACLQQKSWSDRSGKAQVRWVIKMGSRREVGKKGGERRKRWEALPRKNREAGIWKDV